jgi:hypothetical protein
MKKEGNAKRKSASLEELEFAENIFNTVREPLLLLDKELKVVKASHSFLEFFKVSPLETIGKLIYELGNGQWDIPELRELLETILPERTTFDNFEVHHKFSGVGNRIMLLNARQIDRAFGKKRIILLAIEDITERKLKEESFSEKNRLTNEYLDILFNHAHVPIIIWDSSSIITRYNNAFEELIGFDLNEVPEKKLEILFPKDKTDYSLELIKNTLNNEVPELIELDILTKDNKVKTVLWNSTNIFDEQGKNVVATVAQDITSRKKIEESLVILETRYRRLFETAQDGILILDAETGMIIDVNPFLIDLLGYTKSDFVEKEIWEIGFFKDIAANKKKFSELQENQYVRYDNLPLETADGRKISVEFVSNVYQVNKMKVIQCNIRDITERDIAEKALKSSENRLRVLVQTIPDLIWLKDESGTYMSCNPMFEKFFGAKESQIKGKTDYDFVDRELADFFREHDRKAMAAGKPTRNEEWITFAEDGHRAFLETIKAPMYDNKSDLIGILGIGRDITDRKLAEEALRDSEERYRAFFENSMDAILITIPDGRTLSANQAACKMFGYSEAELIVLGKSGIVDETDPRLSELISERDSHGKAIGELFLIRKNGIRFPAEISSAIFRNHDGETLTSMIIRDISDRKLFDNELIKAKNKAEESDRLKTAFLANMSHEIRTPMNGILGFTELLKEPKLSGEEQQEYIGIIEKSGIRLLNIINDIINISKADSGNTEIYISDTNINEQIEYIFNFFKPLAEEKKLIISIKTPLSRNDAFVRTDREKIYAVLTNLVNNALKFTHTGSVEFGYNIREDFIEFFVKDTGIGVPDSQRELIFERFRQGSESLSRNYEGAGLGLTISKAYVEMLGGKIWVESNPERLNEQANGIGNGSVFFFTIPYVPVGESEVSQSDDSNDGRGATQISGLKILIAEDDEASQALIEINVMRFAREIIKVSNGYDAIEACRANVDIDLVLMDLKLPEINGYEATRQIRSFNTSVVIIAQTAYGLDGDKIKAIKAGCTDYISKPLSQTALFKLIDKYFKNIR